MSGIPEYQSPAQIVGTVGLSVPVLTDSHIAALGDFGALGMDFNGSTWDMRRNNNYAIIMALAARTATATTPLITNTNAKGYMIVLNITAASGTGGLTIYFQTQEGIILFQATVARIATGIFGYMVYPGIGAANGTVTQTILQTANFAVPRLLTVTVVHGDASSYTYQVLGQTIL